MSRVLAKGVTLRAVFLVLAESSLIIGAVGMAAYIRLGEWTWIIMAEEHGFAKALLIAAVCQLCLYYSDLYDFHKISDRRDLFVRIAQALGAASFILALIYFWFPNTMIGRGVFFLAAIIV